jgi:hypothetical protein
VNNRPLGKRSDASDHERRYRSVEFSINGLELPYHVRIWENASESMSILVNEGSSVLPLLKVGDTLDSKYYSEGSVYPSKNMRTLIKHITKNKNGRLKGHYLIGLKIINSQPAEGSS